MLTQRVLSVVALGAVTIALGACGDDDSSTSDTTASSAASSGNAELIAKAEAEVEKAKEVAEFPGPTKPFSPGTGRMAIITCAQAGADCAQAAKDGVAATKAMGWTPSPIFDGEFSPQTQAAYVNQAVQEKYDGILLVSIDPGSIKQAVENALAHDIPVACVLCYSPQFADKIFIPASDWVAEGKAMAWSVIASSGGKGLTIQHDDASYPATTVRTDSFEATIAENCPDCEVKKEAFPTTDLQKPGSPSFNAELSANPKGTLGSVVMAYDAGAELYLKTLQQTGRSEINLHGYGASRAMIQGILDGQAVSTVGDPYEYATWAGVDQIGREKAGAEQWDSSTLPAGLIDKTNAEQYVDKYYGPEGDWHSNFTELWQ